MSKSKQALATIADGALTAINNNLTSTDKVEKALMDAVNQISEVTAGSMIGKQRLPAEQAKALAKIRSALEKKIDSESMSKEYKSFCKKLTRDITDLKFDYLMNKPDAIDRIVSGVVSVATRIAKIGKAIVTAAQKTLQWISKQIGDLFSWISEKLSPICAPIASALKNTAEYFKTNAQALYKKSQPVRDYLGNKATAAKETIGRKTENIRNTFGDMKANLKLAVAEKAFNIGQSLREKGVAIDTQVQEQRPKVYSKRVERRKGYQEKSEKGRRGK